MKHEGRRVEVMRKHILAGRRCSRLYCPVNLAIQEQAPKAVIRVQLDSITIDGVKFRTPKRAAQFMDWFDRLPTRRRAKTTLRGLSFTLQRAGN